MPRNRGTRRRLAPGIYRDAVGYAATVAVGSGARRRQKEKRFPHGTKVRVMQEWQDLARAGLRAATRLDAAKPLARVKHSLRVVVKQYLPTIKSRACYVARSAELAAWVSSFGDRDCTTLTPLELQEQLERWHEQGVAASTLNHRISSLSALYQNVRDGVNPAKALRRYREPDPEPRALAYEDVEAILDAMPDGATKDNCRVLAYTGLPFVRQARLQAKHLVLEQKHVWLEGRRKGKGTQAKTIPLTEKGIEALQVWQAHGMRVSSSASRTISFARAVKKVNAARLKAGREDTLPADVRAYDFRHTFGTWVFATTRDIQSTAAMLDCSVETAMRYARGALQGNMEAIRDALNAQWKVGAA